MKTTVKTKYYNMVLCNDKKQNSPTLRDLKQIFPNNSCVQEQLTLYTKRAFNGILQSKSNLKQSQIVKKIPKNSLYKQQTKTKFFPPNPRKAKLNCFHFLALSQVPSRAYFLFPNLKIKSKAQKTLIYNFHGNQPKT